VGDLSGKYGKMTGSSYQSSYLDLYTSTRAGPASFFGNRSVVIHTANATRLTCANFQIVAAAANATASATASVRPSASPSATSTRPPIQSFTGAAAAQKWVSGAAVVAGVLAFAL
jgi:hypothetical protein